MSKENKLEQSSLALDILKDLKKTNKRLILANILLIIALVLAIIF